MRPTLNPEGSFSRDVVVVRRTRHPHLLPEGAVVALRHPRRPDHHLIKRLVRSPDPIPPGHCWVASDAGVGRYLDSSVLGPVPHDRLLGRAVWIVYPFHRLSAL